MPHLLAFILAAGLLFGVADGNGQQKQSGSFSELAARAQKASDEDRIADAIRFYKQALVLQPQWSEGWWSLATLEYDEDHYADAATHFRKVTALQPENGTAQAMLGLCEFELGRNEPALRHIQKGKGLGLQKNPELWQVVLFHEGILFQRRGSFQAAQDTLEELCFQAGSNDEAATILGMTMLRLSSNEPPPPGSKEGDIVLRVGRAQCLAGQKKYDQARSAFESLVNENPSYPNIHYAFGLFFFEIHDVGEGVNELKQEIANNPGSVPARLRIAAGEYKQNSSAGLPYAEEAVKLDPQQPFAHMLLGLLRLDVDDYLGAIPELEIARKGLPAEPKIYAALGSAYSRAGRRQDAVQARFAFARLTAEKKQQAAATITPEPRNSNSQITLGDLSQSSR